MKKFIGNYNDYQKMTNDELLEMIATMTPEEKEDLINNYIATKGMYFLGVKNYIAHKYFPTIFRPAQENKGTFSERLEAILSE